MVSGFSSQKSLESEHFPTLDGIMSLLFPGMAVDIKENDHQHSVSHDLPYIFWCGKWFAVDH